ncbi:SWIB-domain-containing protein [Leucogyrophana mollusca]|uniref:SWIB-domain-containing protein n=1 Tax=Leucogyrophana mollusca TaxID=85980 RepID=A0ACB8BP59_9AGAM|nr:SWIB-domain-containing protein [Leucogyrophana mollusca]
MTFDVQSLEPHITRILTAPGTDLSTISAKRVRKQLLEEDVGLTPEGVKEHRKALDTLIGSVFERVNREATEVAEGSKRQREDDDEEREQDGGDDEEPADEEDEEQEGEQEEAVPKPAKKKGKKTTEELDAELARKLSTQINSRSRRGASNGASASPKKPAKRKPKKSAATIDSGSEDGDEDDGRKKKKRGGAKGGFAKEYNLSEPLSVVIQVNKLSRPQVVKRLWEYIRGHDLQNPKNKREIICDDALRAVFAVDKIDMFKMNKVLGEHLHHDEE